MVTRSGSGLATWSPACEKVSWGNGIITTTMIIDGKAIAADIEGALARAFSRSQIIPTLAIVVVGNDPVIESFVRIKKRVGERLHVPFVEHRFPESATGEELINAVRALGQASEIKGIIVQLPLPAHVNAQAVLDAVPLNKDVDMLSTEAVAAYARGDASVLPPVAGAIQEILERAKVSVVGKETLVLGHGRLVGAPAATLLRYNHAYVTVIDREIPDLAFHVRESDIVILGVGKPGLILPEMLMPGVVLIDAGTSESGGKIVGDADPRCAEIASVFTPVPGGVGPIAVMMIYKNLYILTRE